MGTCKESSPIRNVKISQINFKESILNKERMKRSYQTSDCMPETYISPSRSEMEKNKVEKIFCFLKYISNDLGPMISLEMIHSAPTKLMYH